MSEATMTRDPRDSGENPANAVIDKIGNFDGQVVTLRGWVVFLRSSGKISFLEIRDGTGLIQCVAGPKDVGEEKFKLIQTLTLEDSVIIQGTVKKEPRSKAGYEIIL